MRKNFKCLVKAVSILTAMALFVTTPLPYAVKAAETRYEAEDADLSEAVSSQEGSSMIEEVATASGGKSVGYFSVTGNKITWTVNHEGGEVSLGFGMASGLLNFEKSMETFFAQMVSDDMNLEGNVKVFVNGTECTFIENSVLPGCADENVFKNWTTIYVPATLQAGENKITLEVVGTAAPNIDFLEICAAGMTNSATAGGDTQPGDSTGETGNTGSATFETIVLEAEDATIAGTPAFGDTFVEEKASASGGKSVGYFGTAGNKISWTVNGPVGDVTLTFVLASGAMDWTTFSNCDMQLAGQVKITVNGTEIAYADQTLAGNANYDNWTDVNVNTTLKEGDNEVTLEFVGTTSPNIDCLKVGPSGQAGNTQPSGNTDASFETIVLEGEDATVEGSPSMEGANFVEEQASASGGKSLGYLGVAGNKVIWTFDHVGGDATLTFTMASGVLDWTIFANADMNLEGSVKLTVNGTEISFGSKVLPGSGTFSFDNWTEVDVNATLVAGQNTVVLEILDNPAGVAAPNVDCLKVGPRKGGSNGGSNGGSTGTGFAPVKIEAEDAEIQGTPSYGDTFIEDKASASGGKSVGYLGTPGNKIIFKTDKADGDATLNFRIASAAFDMATFGNGDMQVVGNIKITVNGTEITFADQTLKGNESYDNWVDFKVTAKLNSGMNEIVLETVGSGVNIDYLEITSGSSSGNGGGGTTIIEKEVIVEKEVTVNKYVNVPTPIVKTAKQNLKDIAFFSGIILAILAVVYFVVSIIRKAAMSAEDKKAYAKVKEERKALKADFSKNYKTVSGAEEKEIARYDYQLKCKEAKEKAYKDIESLTYGEGKSRAKALDSAYKKHLPACIAGIIAIACILGTILGISYTGNVVTESAAPVKANSSLIVTGYDWGPGANKLVLNFTDNIKAADITADMFEVQVTKEGFMAVLGDTVAARTVVDAYISDEQGNKVSGKSKYVTIEMSVSPADDTTNPFHYDFMDTQRNTWANPYTHVVTLKAGKKLQIGKTIYSKLDCTKQNKTICPELNDVTETTVTYEGIELRYASYAPEKLQKDNQKNALIIWLHGMGEGGTDIRINTLGNRVTALWQDDVQKCFDGNGAYVLAPQTPTMWMDNGTGELSTGATASMYADALWKLITEYVNANPDIDTNRIIIGGCSNGGYMTMNMLILHADYFAAAYPCCEAYGDENISDTQLAAIKNVPMWFTHAKNDPTVDPNGFTVATYKRLVAAGAKEVHFSFWDEVTDLSGLYKNENGTAYSYNGHYSWIYALNNACTKDFDGSNVQLNGKDVTIWQWLAAQKK